LTRPSIASDNRLTEPLTYQAAAFNAIVATATTAETLRYELTCMGVLSPLANAPVPAAGRHARDRSTPPPDWRGGSSQSRSTSGSTDDINAIVTDTPMNSGNRLRNSPGSRRPNAARRRARPVRGAACGAT
jgi:hypothetical protein